MMSRFIVLVSVLVLLLGTVQSVLQNNQTANAANAKNFNPENIISDFVFRNDESMTTSQIQSFFEKKNSACLKDKYVLSLHDTDNDGMGDEPYGLGENKKVRVSTLIKQASKIYNISPRVILATLEKEQGLVTRQDCPSWRYNTALGYGCPDTAPCDNSAYGFTRQIDYGTWHFMGFYEDTYPVPPTVPGKKYIYYNPKSSCGGKSINIRNRATAALYSYTPYQPNSATLAAAPGETVYCGAYGNLNFWRYFTDWFGSTQSNVVFKNMKTPRWMELKDDVRKVDPYTGNRVDGVLSKGMQIYLTDIITVRGVSYLRTSHDSRHKLDKAIPLSSIQEVPVNYEALKSARWIVTTKNVQKVDPVTLEPIGDVIPAGTEIFFPTLTTVGNTLYIRTEADTHNSRRTGIAYDTTKLTTASVEYESFAKPRWMTLENDTRIYDLKYLSGSNSPVLSSGTQLYFDHKVTINEKTYAVNGRPADGTYRGTPLNDLRNIESRDFQSLKYQRAYRTLETTKKIDVSSNNLAEEVKVDVPVYFQTLIKLGDKLYLRSAHDTSEGRTTTIPLDKVTPVDVTFESMKDPRRLRVRFDLKKIDPVTLQRLDSVIDKGRAVAFSEVVWINDEIYLRTEHDARQGHYKVIPLSSLREL